MKRRFRIWKARLLRRIGRALSPYVWPPALVDRVTELENLLESDGAGTPSRRLDRLDSDNVAHLSDAELSVAEPEEKR